MVEGRDAMAFLNLTPNVRGLRINGKSTYAAIYVNGRKMNLPPDKMAEYLSHLPAENLEYIRIAPGRTIKGGSQEAGGAIFLRLRTGDGGLTNGSAGISADMYTSGPGAEASVPLTLLHSGKNYLHTHSSMEAGHYSPNFKIRKALLKENGRNPPRPA